MDDGLTFVRGFLISLPVSILMWVVILWLLVKMI